MSSLALNLCNSLAWLQNTKPCLVFTLEQIMRVLSWFVIGQLHAAAAAAAVEQRAAPAALWRARVALAADCGALDSRPASRRRDSGARPPPQDRPARRVSAPHPSPALLFSNGAVPGTRPAAGPDSADSCNPAGDLTARRAA